MQKTEKQRHYQQLLLQEKRNLEERMESYEDRGLREPMGFSSGELSLYDNHPGDMGSEMFERGKDFALREDAAELLQEVEDALGRLEQGVYGKCLHCGMEIQEERLEEIPYTSLCYKCKQKSEELPHDRTRPVEEEILEEMDVYGLTQDENALDGEDAWQNVAYWNEHAPFSGAGSYEGREGS